MNSNRDSGKGTGVTGYLFVFRPPLPVPEPVAVFVEGRSRAWCTKKFRKQVPGMAKLRRRNPKRTRQLMQFTGCVQLTIITEVARNRQD